VNAVDWEAVATYRDRTGHPMLAIADIGDNAASRASVAIVVLPEPTLTTSTVRPARVIRLRYPSGPVDAEALLVDPDGQRAFIVTKGLGGTLFEVPPAVWTGRSAAGAEIPTLVRRAGVPLMFVTDAVMGPGGHPLLRTYGELAVLPAVQDGLTGGSLEPLAVVRLPDQQQGEGVALRDGRTALVGTEGVGRPVHRVPLPDEASAAPAPSAAPGTSTESVTSPRAGGGHLSGRALPVLGGAVVTVGAIAALTARGRRRRGPHRPS
jgi:hypothetical protein